MKVRNRTRGADLATRALSADSWSSRFRGLMLRPSLDDAEGLIIRPCNSIHMFFMRFPIDAVFADKDGRVLHLCESLRPWRVSRVVRGAAFVVELPEGAVSRSGTERGDQLVIEVD